MIHGLGPGGGVDVTARILAEHFSKHFNQPVAVESRPGAASIVAACQVARSRPDGYTIAVFPSTYAAAAALRNNLPFRPVDDFTSIGQISDFPYVIATYRDYPNATLADLIRAARTASRPPIYGTPGEGSAQHLLMAMLAKLANIELQHVPFRGGPQALTEVLAKRIDIIVDAPLILSDHFRSGSLRPLAVTTRERSGLLPGVPTVAEAGFSDFDVKAWMGLVGPSGMPKAIVQVYGEALTAALGENTVKDRFNALGTVARNSSGEQFRALLTADITRWKRVIAEAGIARI